MCDSHNEEWNTLNLTSLEPVISELGNIIINIYIVASELKDPICHSDECQIGSFSSEATIYLYIYRTPSHTQICYSCACFFPGI